MSKLAPARIVSIVLLIWAVSVGSVAGEGAKANCMSGDCNANKHLNLISLH
jgi:hypothetical protein